MISGLLKQLKSKPRSFYYRPISYDPEMKEFHEKVIERGKQNKTSRFQFRAQQKAAIKKEFQMRALRFIIIIMILCFIAAMIINSKKLDQFAEWLVNG